MKKSIFLLFFLVVPLLLVPSWEIPPLELGIITELYDEPLLRPGLSLGADWEYSLSENHKLGLSLPVANFHYFPDNLISLAVYGDLAYRYVGEKGFYTAFSFGSGLYLYRKIVPVYDIQGEQIDAPLENLLYLSARWQTGVDLSKKKNARPARVYAALGWKGLYPNNLSFLNQPFIIIGMNYKVAPL